ncbi:MAG TPA: SMI1/KNR4 family protein [Candidatus Binataceae bacterium]|nr:SMI1/KNR4 family protein [Candidatus Binataceae bacterium]
MTTNVSKIDELVDRFVEMANREWVRPLPADQVPEALRTHSAGESDRWFEWKIRASDSTPWVATFEERVGFSLPRPFRSLISRYRFAEFTVGPISFFANTGVNLDGELSRAVFADKGIWPFLLKIGYIQFGRPAGGSYDPVCFDTTRGKNGDAPIVRIDHEGALIRNRLSVVENIAPSFAGFMESAFSGAFKPSR